MTYKQIEASREVRLWIGQVIVPAVVVATVVLSRPEVRQTAANAVSKIKEKFQPKKDIETVVVDYTD